LLRISGSEGPRHLHLPCLDISLFLKLARLEGLIVNLMPLIGHPAIIGITLRNHLHQRFVESLLVIVDSEI